MIGKRSITRQDLAQFGLQPGPNAPGRVIFGMVDDYVNPYAQQASFEIERAVGLCRGVGRLSVHAGSAGCRGFLDRNLFHTGARTARTSRCSVSTTPWCCSTTCLNPPPTRSTMP